jgi:phosphomannomutase
VTTTLIGDIAESFNLKPLTDLFVGYKFIAQEIAKLPDPTDFVFSAEESLGYLAGTFVRDKDAAIAALLVAEMASWLKDQGMTVPQYLDSIYQRLGYYKNLQYLVELPGRRGREIMEQVMLHLRAKTPEALAGLRVVGVNDWLDPSASAPGAYKMGGSADMLAYVLSDDGKARITARPSGTEPKLKYYIQLRADVDGPLETVRARVDQQALDVAKAVGEWSGAGLSPAHRQEWSGAIQRLV